MLSFSPAYVLLLIVVVAAIFYCYQQWTKQQTKKDKEKPEDHAIFQIVPFVTLMLENLNCKFTHEENESWHQFQFKFQSGNFLVFCKEGDHHLRIHYPNFFVTSIDDLELIQELCNKCNLHNYTHHLFYTTHGEENSLTVHITTAMCVVDDNHNYTEQLGILLSSFFELAQRFYLLFKQEKGNETEVTPHLAEKSKLIYQREFFMIREMEMQHQPSKVKLTASLRSPLSIGKILSNLYGWDNPELLELKVVTHELRTVVDENEIADFDISQVLIAKNDEGVPNFVCHHATLILTLAPVREEQSLPTQLVIALQDEGNTSETLYMRATLSMPPVMAHNRNFVATHDNPNEVLSFIFAFDLVEREQIEKKLQQTLDSLDEKCEKSNTPELESDELVAYFLDNQNVTRTFQYAESLFREKRFYETIIEMEYLYRYLSPRYYKLSQLEKERFYDICYHIGFSYCALGLYKQAYYYLDAIVPISHSIYLEQYINCLVDAKDFRTLTTIRNMESSILKQMESEKELSEEIKPFLNFLQRRKAHHLIDLGYYDEAQKILQKMYDASIDQDYALNELAYLQHLRKQHSDIKDDTSINDQEQL